MRYLRYLVLAAIAVVLIVVSLANRGVVSVSTLPEGMAQMPLLDAFAFEVQLPLFIVIFGGIVAGLLIGFVWEWVREHKHRSMASKKNREAHQLKQEVNRLKGERHEGKDEVLALLDER